MSTANTIVLAGMPIYPQEYPAGEAGVMPGHLLTFGSGGTANKLLKHATAGGEATPMFADVNVTPDRSVATEPVATAYASGETVKWLMAQPGDLILAWVPASATAVIRGSRLMSTGDGTLSLFVAQTVTEAGTATAYTVKTNPIVAIAAEALDNSAGATAARLKVWAV